MTLFFRILAVLSAVLILPAPAVGADPRIRSAVDVFQIGPEKKTLLDLYVTSREAARAVASYPDVVLIDVRAPSDVQAVGIAIPVHRNVPYLVANDLVAEGRPAMAVNPKLVTHVDRVLRGKRLDRSATIVIMCIAGVHSARAADHLAERGFKNVYTVVDGFEGDRGPNGGRTVNGWRNHNLPWSLTARSDQMAFALPR